MTLERAKQIIQENFGDKYDVEFSLAPSNIQQQVQLDKAKKCTHPENYIYCCHYYSDSDLCSARSGPCELT